MKDVSDYQILKVCTFFSGVSLLFIEHYWFIAWAEEGNLTHLFKELSNYKLKLKLDVYLADLTNHFQPLSSVSTEVHARKGEISTSGT